MRLCLECGLKQRVVGRNARYCEDCSIIVKRRKHNIVNRAWEKKNEGKRKEYRMQYDRSELGKAKYRRFHLTENYRAYARNRYKNTDESVRRARYYLSNAVRDRRVERPDRCENCGIKDWGEKRSMIEAHHYLGYKKENWLKVQWLCVPCHKNAEEVFLDL